MIPSCPSIKSRFHKRLFWFCFSGYFTPGGGKDQGVGKWLFQDVRFFLLLQNYKVPRPHTMNHELRITS